LTLVSSDPGTDTISGWDIAWGDGSTQHLTGNPGSATHTYADGPNAYAITATATDEDGTFAAANSVSVAVSNVAPAVSISGAGVVDQRVTYTLGLSATGDPGQDTVSGWTVAW